MANIPGNSYDDVCGEIGWLLWAVGSDRRKKTEVLSYPVWMINNEFCSAAIIAVDDVQEAVWKRRLRKAKEFFQAAADYRSSSDYDRWFVLSA